VFLTQPQHKFSAVSGNFFEHSQKNKNMDNYKSLFEQGKNAYLKALEAINWFDNPYVSKTQIIKNIQECGFDPYLVLTLTQVSYDSEGFNEDINAIKSLMDQYIKFIPTGSYRFEGSNRQYKLITTVNNNNYDYQIDLDTFDPENVETYFVGDYINKILERENIIYRFYELPPGGQDAALIYVTPSMYNKAIEIGLIPDFIGYLAVNY
jgi:hypothetical protein